MAIATAFRSRNPLSLDQIQRYAPSVLATEAHESRGERYSFIPTIQVVDGLREAGFQPYAIAQTRCRDADKRAHTKHMVRFRKASHLGTDLTVGQELPEIVLVNSHDGTSSYQLMSGFYRLVCSNGLVVGRDQNEIRIRHSGNVVGDVIDGCTRILDDVQLGMERVERFKGIQLDRAEQHAFASAALALRWDDKAPITETAVLTTRRVQDHSADLWTTFNKVQENLIRGGLRGRGASGSRMTTRAVQGVNENLRLNKALWVLADAMAAHKSN